MAAAAALWFHFGCQFSDRFAKLEAYHRGLVVLDLMYLMIVSAGGKHLNRC